MSEHQIPDGSNMPDSFVTKHARNAEMAERERAHFDRKNADRHAKALEENNSPKDFPPMPIPREEKFRPGEEPQYLGPRGKFYPSMGDVRRAKAEELRSKLPRQPSR